MRMSKSEAELKIKTINESNYQPTEWEDNFIESVLNSTYPTLTDKQSAVVDKIHKKALEAGQS